MTGDNGLLTKAGQAKNASSDAEIEEQIKLAIVESQTSKYLNIGKSELENIEESLSKTFKDTVTVTKMGKGYKVRIGNTKTTYRMKANGTVYKYEEMDPTNIYGKLNEDDEILYLRSTPGNNYEEFTKWNHKYRIERKWNKEKIKKVIIEEPIAPDTVCDMFYDCWNLKEIEMIENLHVENTTSFNGMFQGCTLLENIDLDKFDTCNVTDMCRMFYGCAKIKKLNLEGIETSNVNNMNSMFRGCNKLNELDLNSFDTSNVTDMSNMFHDCTSIIELDLRSFNTEKVTIMNNMFNCCGKLKSVDMKSFNLNNVTEISNMFYGVPNTIVIKATPATKTRIIGEYPNLENNFE